MTVSTLNSQERVAARLGWVVFACSLAFFLFLAPAYSVPGRWAAIAASFAGLDVFQPATRPLWSGLAASVRLVPILNVGLVLNAISALIGAVACWLIYEIVRNIPYRQPSRKSAPLPVELSGRMIGGLAAAAFAIGAPPLMKVASRGDHTPLDLLLMLAPFYAALRFARDRSPVWFGAACLLFSLSCIENPASLFGAPLFVFWMLIVLAQQHRMNAQTLLRGGAAALTGPLVLLIFWRLILATDGSAARGFDSLWDVARDYLRIYKQEMLHGVPRLGWFLILVLNLLPFLIVILRKLDEPRDLFTTIGSFLFRAVLFGVAMLTLLNLPGAPQRVIGDQIILLTPTIVVALWFGFLIGYQYAAWRAQAWRIPAVALVVASGTVIAAAGALHARDTRASRMDDVVKFARQIVAELEGRSVIVTDGKLDSFILLAAREAGRAVTVVNLNAVPSREYARAYAARFGRSDGDLATPASVLQRALADEPERITEWALLTNPDSIRSPEHASIPIGAAYRFFALDALPDPEQTVAARHLALPPPDPERLRDPASPAAHIARWLSRLANDVGAVFHYAGMPERAAEFYRRALAYWPDNASAAINLFDYAEGSPDETRGALQAIIQRLPDARMPAFRAQFCGRIPDVIRRASEATALLEEDPLDRALEKNVQPPRTTAPPRSTVQPSERAPSPEQRRELESRIAAHLRAARAAVRAGDPLRANLHVEQAFELAPLRPDILAAAGQIYLLLTDFDRAIRCWNLLQLQFPNASPVLALRGATRFYEGSDDQAEALLDEAVTSAPGDYAARFYLAALRIRQDRIDDARAAFAAPPLADLLRSLDSVSTERDLLVRRLGTDGYAHLLSIISSKNSATDDDVAEARALLRDAVDAMSARDWPRAIEKLSAVIKAGFRSPTLPYNLALARYHAEPAEKQMDIIENIVLIYPGADAFARSFAYLCMEIGDFARAERALERAEPSDELLLMRAASAAGRGDSSRAWEILAQIQADRRGALVPWFEHPLPAIRALHDDARFASWTNTPAKTR